METYLYSAIITVLNALLLFALSVKVGLARVKEKVSVVDSYTTTSKTFIIANRVHLNTLESTLVFLPFLWVATVFSGLPHYAALVGAVWILGRLIYAYGYYQDPSKRAPGFFLSLLALVGLLGLCLYGFYLNW